MITDLTFSLRDNVTAQNLKQQIIGEVESNRRQLIELSHKIHSHPEVGFKESKAASWLSNYLSENGFTIEKGCYGLTTAFCANYGSGKPAIGIISEYDALPGIGHACGHNIIAASAAGAAAAARLAVDQFGGSILVIGTPAEEAGGGKIIMAERGAFTDVDIAMMIHPGVHDTVIIHTLASQVLEVEFTGKAAHAAARPEEGINALEALLQSFTAINSLRQHIRDQSRIHGIITDGGQAANIVPEHSAATFIVRAESDRYLNELKHKVLRCFTGAAMASGAHLEYRWHEQYYATMQNNLILARLFQKNMASLGRKMKFSTNKNMVFSTDMGNISQMIPSIHPMLAIAREDISLHSSEFVSAAASEEGIRAVIEGATAMSLTIVDLLSDPSTTNKVKEQFHKTKRGAKIDRKQI